MSDRKHALGSLGLILAFLGVLGEIYQVVTISQSFSIGIISTMIVITAISGILFLAKR